MNRLFALLLFIALGSNQVTSAGDLALEPPLINTSPGPEYSHERRDYAMTIGIERTPKGRLWSCWVAGGDSHLGYFVLATSDDHGQTWSQPRLVIDPTDAKNGTPRRTLVGNLWIDPTGKLWLFFDQSLGYYDGRAGAWAITCDNPDAEQPVWSEPRRIWHGCTLNKPTVLKDGTWLMPISLWQRSRINTPVATLKGEANPEAFIQAFKDAYHELDDERQAWWFASNDQGKTWTKRGGVLFPKSDFDEHMLVELKDGKLWMLARTADGMAESYSEDQGRTWSKPQVRFPHISARFFLRRLKSGNLLLVKHGQLDERTAKRTHLRAFISKDDGETWQGGLLLDERNGVSYPDGFQTPAGRIFIQYDRERANEREILFADFTEADVLAGKLVDEQSRLKQLVSKATGNLQKEEAKPQAKADTKAAAKPAPFIPAEGTEGSSPEWAAQAAADAKQDRSSIPYDGITPNKMVCDTTLRQLPDGSWILFFLAGGDTEPSPKNYTAVCRSNDQGKTWTKAAAFDTTFPREGKTIGQGPTELMIRGNECTLFFSTHSNHWNSNWQSWLMRSSDNCRTWTKPEPVPGRLAQRTFIRNHIVARDGRIIAPFQHYIGPSDQQDKPILDRKFTNPRNGVIISSDGGKTWTEHGNIALTDNDQYFGWAEANIAELSDGRIAMIIRADKLGGVLYYAESTDGGKTWPAIARKTDIPNPGSKATLYPLGGDTVAMLHNPNPSQRSPLALWISFDGLKTWPYRRVLVPESSDGPKGRINYPDGFVSADKQWLHFAYDDNRHRAVHYSAKLPARGAGK
jgi:predicted neuraminidase